MTTSESCELTPVHRWNASRFTQLTFPRFRSRLQMIDADRGAVALGALSGEDAAGLVLAEHRIDEGLVEVLSVYVTPSWRGRGIGSALLRGVEQVAAARACRRLQLVYVENPPGTQALERVLVGLGWQPPKPRMVLCAVDRRVLHANWLDSQSLPEDFEVFPWCELQPDEREKIKGEHRERPWYPEVLSPFREEDILEPATSLGLRYQGRVAGWLITHRVGPRTVRYTTLFVREDLRGHGSWLALVVEALRRQAREIGLESVGTFGFQVQNTAMLRIVENHLAPYLASKRQSMGTFKILPEPA